MGILNQCLGNFAMNNQSNGTGICQPYYLLIETLCKIPQISAIVWSAGKRTFISFKRTVDQGGLR